MKSGNEDDKMSIFSSHRRLRMALRRLVVFDTQNVRAMHGRLSQQSDHLLGQLQQCVQHCHVIKTVAFHFTMII